ncbi:MAG: DUF3422 domain-containing protein [Gemmatimonadaceae bacterium]|nr:DUF3422 domain-containing protein [Acetobacteraceae bacterium]
MTGLPANHPQRLQLNNEVHARPPDPLAAPTRLSYLALFSDSAATRDAGFAAVCALAERQGVAPPPPGANHYSADLGPFRLKWERHTEFVRYTFIVSGQEADPFEEPAIATVPADWLAGLPGQLMIAAHVALVPPPPDDAEAPATRLFPRDVLVGSVVSGGSASVFTDFRVRYDGFSRMLVQDRDLSPAQAGRVVQCLLEIETYRIMALLALPVAQALAPVIARCEREVAEITAAMVTARDQDEPVLLDRLTRLAAEIDSRQADNLYRFSAANAYDGVVQSRIQELREARISGLQTLQEFTDRRLAPAMNTCRSVAARQEELSRRVARATQLLATRVGVTRERQNQSVLEAMNRRVRLQLRLQSTVEGLSIAAVTYYIVGLVGYAAKAARGAGAPFDPDVAMGISIPIVAALMFFGLRRVRRAVSRE